MLTIQFSVFVPLLDNDGAIAPLLVPTGNGAIHFQPLFTWSSDVKSRVVNFIEAVGKTNCTINIVENEETLYK